MDLNRPVTFRGVSLNTATPAVGRVGISGCIVERADISQVGHVEFMEKRRLADGMDAIEPYVSAHKLTLHGTVFGPTRGQAFDALQVLREAMNPVKTLLASPSTKGFLPLSYTEPTNTGYASAKTLQVRPQGLRFQTAAYRSGTSAKVAGKEDAVALGIAWSVDMEVDYNSLITCGDTTLYAPPWPPAPERPLVTSAARCVLFYPNGAGDIAVTGLPTYDDVAFGSTGDAPQTGYPGIPTTGRLAPVLWAPAPLLGGVWRGIRALSAGLLNIEYHNNALTACANETVSSQAFVLLDAVVIGSSLINAGTYTNPGAFGASYDISLTNIPVAAGQLISVIQHSTSTRQNPFIITSPAGTGSLAFTLDISGVTEVPPT